MQPKLSLSPVSISQCAFEDAFHVTAEAGFTGIGLRYNQLEDYLARGHTLKDVHDLLRRHGLVFTEAAFLAEWQFHGGVPLVCQRRRSGGHAEEPGLLRRKLQLFLERCEAFECANATAVPALRETGDLAVAAEEFGALCDAARPYGVRLCLEFMGSAPQIRDLATARDVVTRAGRANGGVLIDTFLFHEGGSALADLHGVDIDKVFNVQLADAKPLPPSRLDMLTDRLFPGEGTAPVAAIAATLATRGYAGWWTVELFNPEYATRDPAEIAGKAHASARAMLPETLPASRSSRLPAAQ
ncbi:MAG: sugar phosphate isomerase/epimerase family protein [Alphaproteobacteria bacterium]